MIGAIIFSLAYAFIMIAHGDELFDSALPTTVNRIACSVVMAALPTFFEMYRSIDGQTVIHIFLWSVVTIGLWIWPGEMSEITQAIGGDSGTGSLRSRIEGTLLLTLRESVIILFVAGLCFFTHHSYWPMAGCLLMGLPYFISGYVLPADKLQFRRWVVLAPHAIKGLILGAMTWSAIS